MFTLVAHQNDLSVLRSEFPSLPEAVRRAFIAGRQHGASGIVEILDPDGRLLFRRDYILF